MFTEQFFLLTGLYLVPFATTLAATNRRALMLLALIWVLLMLGWVTIGPLMDDLKLAYLPMVVLGAGAGFALRRYTLGTRSRGRPWFCRFLVTLGFVFVPTLVFFAPYGVAMVA